MPTPRAHFRQSDVTKVLKAFRDSGLPTPTIVIKPDGEIVVRPIGTAETKAYEENPWDEVE